MSDQLARVSGVGGRRAGAAWERLKQDKAALAAAAVIALLILIAIAGGPIAQAITGHGPNDIVSGSQDQFGVPFGPKSELWFGADAEGRDLFVRTMYGARISLFVGVVASGIAVFIGLVVGLTAGFSQRSLRPLRREMQMIFQDPYASLNPRKTVGQIVGAPFAIHGMRREARARVRELLERVGLSPEHYPPRSTSRSRRRC